MALELKSLPTPDLAYLHSPLLLDSFQCLPTLVVLYLHFTRLESIAIKIDKSATEAHERNSNLLFELKFVSLK